MAADEVGQRQPEREELCFHRLPYDHYTAARKVRAAGLPEELALRLETGS